MVPGGLQALAAALVALSLCFCWAGVRAFLREQRRKVEQRAWGAAAETEPVRRPQTAEDRHKRAPASCAHVHQEEKARGDRGAYRVGSTRERGSSRDDSNPAHHPQQRRCEPASNAGGRRESGSPQRLATASARERYREDKSALGHRSSPESQRRGGRQEARASGERGSPDRLATAATHERYNEDRSALRHRSSPESQRWGGRQEARASGERGSPDRLATAATHERYNEDRSAGRQRGSPESQGRGGRQQASFPPACHASPGMGPRRGEGAQRAKEVGARDPAKSRELCRLPRHAVSPGLEPPLSRDRPRTDHRRASYY